MVDALVDEAERIMAEGIEARLAAADAERRGRSRPRRATSCSQIQGIDANHSGEKIARIRELSESRRLSASSGGRRDTAARRSAPSAPSPVAGAAPGLAGSVRVRDRRHPRDAHRDRGRSRPGTTTRPCASSSASITGSPSSASTPRVYQAGSDLASPFTFSFIVAALALWSALRRSWPELAACAAAPADGDHRASGAQAGHRPHHRESRRLLVPVGSRVRPPPRGSRWRSCS